MCARENSSAPGSRTDAHWRSRVCSDVGCSDNRTVQFSCSWYRMCPMIEKTIVVSTPIYTLSSKQREHGNHDWESDHAHQVDAQVTGGINVLLVAAAL